MAYKCHNFCKGDVLDAEQMNCIEQGIVAVEDEIAKIKADLAYVPIDITKFTSNAAGTHEIGKVIESVKLSWEINKEPVSQTLDGEMLAADVREMSVTGPISTDKSFSLSVTDDRNVTDKASTSITFLNGVYYGALEYGADIDSAAVLGLTKKLQSGRKVDFTVTPGEGQRPAYALPTRYGTPTVKIGGFEYAWEKVATFDFTNASGYTESYDVWMHGQNVSGSITINVT